MTEDAEQERRDDDDEPRPVLSYASASVRPSRGHGTLVEAMSFSTATEAAMAQSRLAVDEIPSFLDNENVVQFNWMLSNATGGVRVMVHESDLEAARAVLNSPPDVGKIDYRPGAGALDPDDADAASDDQALSPRASNDADGDNEDENDDGYVDEAWRCPACHRKTVDLVPLHPVLLLLALPMLGLPLLFVPRKKHCRSCGHVWKASVV